MDEWMDNCMTGTQEKPKVPGCMGLRATLCFCCTETWHPAGRRKLAQSSRSSLSCKSYKLKQVSPFSVSLHLHSVDSPPCPASCAGLSRGSGEMAN